MLYIVLLGACRWSERFIYFGLFALWALKFHFFVGRLIANKRLPITDNCLKNEQKRYRKSKTNQYTLEKQNETKLKRQTKTKNKRRKTKRKEIRNCWKWENCLTADGWNSLMTPLNFICHQMASSFKDLSLDWLIQNNDDVMILIFDQQREYYANLPISNGIRKH